MPRLPDNERERIQALDRLAIMSTPPENDLNDLAWLAAYTCGTPWAQINFVHSNRVWTKANVGFPETEVRRAVSPCAIVVSQGEMVVITDTFEDSRVNLSPLVVQGPKMRSYAGAPIQTEAGETIGTICVMGPEPKGFNGAQVGALWALSRQVATYLGLRPRSEVSAQQIAESRDDADQRARQYSKRIRQMVEQMPAALWSTDEKLRLTMTLGGGLDAMHLRASEVVGKTLAEIFGTDDPTFPPTAAHVNALSGEPSGLVRWTGWGHTMEIRVVPQFDDDGAIVGTLGVGVDVTERMRMGEAIESFEDTVRTMLEAASSAGPSEGNGTNGHDRPRSDTAFEDLHRQSA